MEKEKIIVRIFCDYIATLAQGIWDYPLYCDDDHKSGYRYFEDYCTLCEDDVVILNDLIYWNMEFDRYYFDFYLALMNNELFEEKCFDPDTFTETGKKLAFRLKLNHPEWEIQFYDEIADDIATFSNKETENTCETTHWYSVHISSTMTPLFLPLSKRRDGDGSWEYYLAD